MGIAKEKAPAAHIAGKEIGEFAEVNAAAAVGGAEVIHVAHAVIAAEADGVAAPGVGGGVGKTFGLAGRSGQRPAGIAAHVIELGAGRDAGETKQGGIGDAGVQSVGGWVHVVIGGKDGFVEAVVAEANFVGPLRIQVGGQIDAEDLGARAGGGKPLGTEGDGVFLGLVGVGIDEAGAEHVAGVEHVISFPDKIVAAVLVDEIEVNGSRI